MTEREFRQTWADLLMRHECELVVTVADEWRVAHEPYLQSFADAFAPPTDQWEW